MEPAVRSARIKSAITTGRPRNDPLLASKTQKISGSRPALAVKTLPRGTEFLDAETGGQNRAERPQGSPETERAERYPRKSPQKRPVLSRSGNLQFGGTGWWCAQSYANPSQRRFHTGNRGNPLFSAFFSQNGEFKSKGFRFPCVLSVGFRAMWRPATARAMWRPATVRGRLWALA